MNSGTPSRTPRPALRRPLTHGMCAAVSGVLALAACSGGDGGDGGTAPAPTAPVTSNFSGEAPTSILSSAASRKAEVQESAASSAAARASEFAASVSADSERARTEARKELGEVQGQGNAVGDVSLTGLPLSATNNVRALLVTMTNRTDRTASFAVQVDFSDSDGKVVETVYVGARDVEAGQKAQRYAISSSPPEPRLTAGIAKAQWY
ncbi:MULTISPECIES: hypothetical protein [unclassified Streptomyces]|uniref:hypothetical protein n=1 Tax=unclassified Streptomyces TaxID=2593676 RepID=UPI001F04184E|nr:MULTISPECIES: hypothetical protein [unclassified Streptomyces]MCH0564173.1 hypothetical protein [Streptomyces sp. MUM 2J]MCH0568476.1 hypothetical protein [Streptomyces sp. MUM 136J]